jgi:riboflavin synthase
VELRFSEERGMFTGIVKEVGRVTSAKSGSLTIIATDILQRLELGGSIAVNGVCLTITSFNANSFSVNTIPETIERTNLGLLAAGDKVNLELPLTLNEMVGGHLVQGHVDTTGRVTSTFWDGQASIITFEAPPEIMRYIVEKGFIAVDGVSLTVTARDTNSFQVSVVDYTRRHTLLGDIQVGKQVNLEVDIIAKYVEQLSQPQDKGITIEYLQESGF